MDGGRVVERERGREREEEEENRGVLECKLGKRRVLGKEAGLCVDQVDTTETRRPMRTKVILQSVDPKQMTSFHAWPLRAPSTGSCKS